MSVALTSVERINALKQGIEATTGETYADLTAGVQALKNGYGQGGGGGTEEIENIIDESGVLDSTDGTVTDKVEKLIDRAKDEKIWYEQFKNNGFATSSTYGLFNNYQGATLPRIDVSKFYTMAYFCGNAVNLERIDFYLNSGLATTFFNAFRQAYSLKYIKGVNTSKAQIVTSMFYNSTALEEIEEPLDFSSVSSINNQSSCFNGTNSLAEVRFVAESIKWSITIPSPVLSDESIQSIIDGLADLTGGTAQTLTLHATVKAKLTETQLATITGKNWSVA